MKVMLLFSYFLIVSVASSQNYNDTLNIGNEGEYMIIVYKESFKTEEISYFNNDKIKSIERYDTLGVKNGLCEYWCDNGLKICEFQANKGIQLYTSKYCSGSKMFEGTFFDTPFHLVGKWISWYENGELMEEGWYNETVKYTESHKIGTWKYYNQEGKLIKEEIFDNKGKLLETRSFRP